MSAMLPLWTLAGSRREIDARLGDKAERETIKQYPSYIRRFVLNPGPEEMILVLTRDSSLAGRTLAELTPAGQDPLDTLIDILRGEGDDIHRPQVLIRMYPEDELASFYQHPQCAVMSDATALSLDGPLGDDIFYGAFTWASWFLRHIVRERKALSLPEAIRRVTSLPAQRIGIGDRGLLNWVPAPTLQRSIWRVSPSPGRSNPQPAGAGHSARHRERRRGLARRRRDGDTCWNRADAGLTRKSRIPTRGLQPAPSFVGGSSGHVVGSLRYGPQAQSGPPQGSQPSRRSKQRVLVVVVARE